MTEPDSKLTREELIARGFMESDVDIALDLLRCISGVDKLVFPDSPAVVKLLLCEQQHKLVARYISECDDSSERVDEYIVTLVDATKWLENEIRVCRLLFWREDDDVILIPSDERPEVPKTYFSIVLGCHEVRHRLQKRAALRLFAPAHAETVADLALSRIIQFMRFKFEADEKILRREGKPEAVIEERTGPCEFDAQVVDKYILHRICWGELNEDDGVTISPQKVSEVLRMQPPE